MVSPKQHYQEYLLQRIEDYKNLLARDELLRLGNDAAPHSRTPAKASTS